VLSDAKEKLSKSKENSSQSPQGLLERYPADAIRYWTASGGLGQDIAFSEPQLKIGLRLITKLWNAFKFIQEHIKDTPENPGTFLGLPDQWLLHNATKTYEKYCSYMDQHEFGLALHVVERFFWNDFCDNYLELIKDQLFNPDKYTAPELKATRWTLHTVGLRILQWYAPYMPHITETIYANTYRPASMNNSLHQTRFKQAQENFLFLENAQLMDAIIEVIAQARKLKSENQLSLKTPFASLTITSGDEQLLHKIMPHTQIIRGVVHAQEIHFKADGQLQTVLGQDGDLWIATIALGKTA
jgi:valyl-tRNA synthetase